MRTTHIKNNISAISALVFAIMSFSVFAQKLPTVQKESMIAPANVNIDGIIDEWGNNLQAYNKATSIYYTLANDNNCLYLAVKITDAHNIQKVLSGGLTISLMGADKKNIGAITYPRYYAKYIAPLTGRLNNPNTDMATEMESMNKLIMEGGKLIQVTGIKGIKDTLVSSPDESGIKAAGILDAKKAYTFELAIPLKYIPEASGQVGLINYKITLKGLGNSLNQPKASGSPTAKSLDMGSMGTPTVGAMASINDFNSPTDFSGTYTIAKK